MDTAGKVPGYKEDDEQGCGQGDQQGDQNGAQQDGHAACNIAPGYFRDLIPAVVQCRGMNIGILVDKVRLPVFPDLPEKRRGKRAAV